MNSLYTDILADYMSKFQKLSINIFQVEAYFWVNTAAPPPPSVCIYLFLTDLSPPTNVRASFTDGSL